jgi:hypothetical protein
MCSPVHRWHPAPDVLLCPPPPPLPPTQTYHTIAGSPLFNSLVAAEKQLDAALKRRRLEAADAEGYAQKTPAKTLRVYLFHTRTLLKGPPGGGSAQRFVSFCGAGFVAHRLCRFVSWGGFGVGWIGSGRSRVGKPVACTPTKDHNHSRHCGCPCSTPTPTRCSRGPREVGGAMPSGTGCGCVYQSLLLQSCGGGTCLVGQRHVAAPAAACFRLCPPQPACSSPALPHTTLTRLPPLPSLPSYSHRPGCAQLVLQHCRAGDGHLGGRGAAAPPEPRPAR